MGYDPTMYMPMQVKNQQQTNQNQGCRAALLLQHKHAHTDCLPSLLTFFLFRNDAIAAAAAAAIVCMCLSSSFPPPLSLSAKQPYMMAPGRQGLVTGATPNGFSPSFAAPDVSILLHGHTYASCSFPCHFTTQQSLVLRSTHSRSTHSRSTHSRSTHSHSTHRRHCIRWFLPAGPLLVPNCPQWDDGRIPAGPGHALCPAAAAAGSTATTAATATATAAPRATSPTAAVPATSVHGKPGTDAAATALCRQLHG